MKRLFDLAIAVIGLLPAAFITVLCCPLVWLETRANPIFAQVRVGRDGKPFTMYKLRTMRADTPDRASHEIGAMAVTRSGQFLRRTKIDELPQLFNVLMGQMSLVGPRPCLPTQVQLVEARSRLGVSALRPGVTGVAQLAGIDMSEPERLAAEDARYLGPWSLRGDLAIVIATALGRGTGDAAVGR